MVNSFYSLVAMAAFAGGMLPLQFAINAQLADRAGSNAIWAGMVSVACSTVALTAVALLTLDRWPRLSVIKDIPLWMWGGGLIGALFVVSSTFVLPRVGAGVFVASVLLGQIVVSMTVDHNGWFGASVEPVSMTRIIGVLLIFGGLYLIRGH